MCVRIQGGVMDCQELGIKQILPEFQKPKSDLGFWQEKTRVYLYPITVCRTKQLLSVLRSRKLILASLFPFHHPSWTLFCT
ncbi:hypothetical protein CROQUDRAFT_398381 [Cronartium quercuum f. sp. fusiforme G11]|uniref:Uncharacterized protein n=1 Tax=Cronartium quercuum f. sp. fusiforme G11 TaxID=708437 RepID=A0A9P6NS32_9BASI|nr:hypothetical protein CROQUDRAFT_398381 [Cronartium quercuum f. sp. fusiforme G11]